MFDARGYRYNIGIILAGPHGKVFWGKRVGQNAWQFPQGGLNENEDVEECLFRELREEIGLEPKDVTIFGCTKHWSYYKLPRKFIRKSLPRCIGQKQKWFLLRLQAPESKINFNLGHKPEFDGWCWVKYWYPLREVIYFKREIYRRALKELGPLFFNVGLHNNRTRSLNHILDN